MLSFGAAALLFAYFLNRTELLYLGCFVLLLPVASLLALRFRRLQLSVTRTFSPPVARAGNPVSVELTVENLAKSPSAGAICSDRQPWAPHSTERAALPALKAAGSRPGSPASLSRLRYRLTPPVRGQFEIGPLLVELGDPFGLAGGAVSIGSSAPLLVTPNVVPLADDAVTFSADEGTTRMLQRRSAGGEDDLMTREYRRGDALRRVHWRASAHHGELMVRQEEQRSHTEARVLLDTRRRNYRDADSQHDSNEPESASFEWAVSFVASLALHLQREGFVVEVIENGRAQLGQADRPEEFLESLATVQLLDTTQPGTTQPGTAGPGTDDPTFSLLRGAERPDRSQGSVFAVISDADSATVAALESQRHAFDLAVVYLVGARNLGLDDRLRRAGWLCIPVTPETAIDAAWLAAGLAQQSVDDQ
jgi:uncharacterized protein (DUF58 family)